MQKCLGTSLSPLMSQNVVLLFDMGEGRQTIDAGPRTLGPGTQGPEDPRIEYPRMYSCFALKTTTMTSYMHGGIGVKGYNKKIVLRFSHCVCVSLALY